MKSRKNVVVFAMGLFIAVALPAPATAASFQGLGDLPGSTYYSHACDVSGDGSVVVGISRSSSGFEAFRWTSGGGMVGLGDLDGGTFWSRASKVSSDGSVVVGDGKTASGREAFRWVEGMGMDGLGGLGGGSPSSLAWGVSADGSVVVGFDYNEAFRWVEGIGMQGLGDLPGGAFASSALAVSSDASVVVGYSSSAASGSDRTEAFRWVEGIGMQGLGDLPGGAFASSAVAVSSDGSVVVGTSSSAASGSDRTEAFRWVEGVGMEGLGDLPGFVFRSYAYDVSGDGSVVVGMGHEVGVVSSGPRAFIWDADNGMRNLKDVLVSDYGLDLTSWRQLTGATGISDDGLTIVGVGNIANGNLEGWIAHIPEAAIMDIGIDIRPGSWPNPLNTKSKGVLPVAVLGTDDFDVMTIDPATILLGLEGFDDTLSPLRWDYEDVGTPYEGEPGGGHELEGDGFVDLSLKFDIQALLDALGLSAAQGESLLLSLSGNLTEANDGSPFEGSDWIRLLHPGDVNADGFVDGSDLSIVISHWGQSVPSGKFGDLDGSGIVDASDYTEVISYWGQSSLPQSPAAIPEPATLALILIGGLLLLDRRHRSA